MSKSVTTSIVTNTIITGSKLFGFIATGSPTLFAETLHSVADVGNQVLLLVGEKRATRTATTKHPFGYGKEKFFWALVSAVSIFFVGFGVTLYHGIHSLLEPGDVAPFTPMTIGLLLFSGALESYTFMIALRELGGFRGLKENRSNTTVLAVLFEDSVALVGIALTLIVAGSSYLFGPNAILDGVVSILVALLLGAMAIILARLNREMLIGVADLTVNREVLDFIEDRSKIEVDVTSTVVGQDKLILFLKIEPDTLPAGVTFEHLFKAADLMKRHIAKKLKKDVVDVFWQFPEELAERPI
jgi:zinc transporter 9